ncbi:MAG: DUF349 domain-containing protein [Flavobacteriales bacterium]
MKEQLIEKLHELLNTDDVNNIRDAVREVRSEWKAESAKEMQIQDTAHKATPVAEGETLPEFVFVPNELEGRYQELLKTYEDRVEEHGRKLAAERQHNLETKQHLLKEFEALLADEQNIGKAFTTHKALKDKWQSTGDVPGNLYHDLNEAWQTLNHTFYYNINIYKQLQEHDLKINQKKKEELIAATEALATVETIIDLEVLVRKYQREWADVGPSPRESYKELGDKFFATLRTAQQRIQAHYDELHSHGEENLQKKKVLVEKMKEITGMELTSQATWNKWTNEVLRMQEEWRNTGWAPKKQNDNVWQEFRGLCDLYFTNLKAQHETRRTSLKGNKEKKEELIIKAEKLQHSEDWKNTSEEIKKLQEEWKNTGSADMRDEQKLWLKFRSHCEHFFHKRNEVFAQQRKEQEDNYKLKADMLTELENLELTGNRTEDIIALKQFGEKWNSVGFVPKVKVKEVMDKYNALMDAKYGKLNAERERREMDSFRSRLNHIKSNGDSDFKLKKERNFMRERIDKLNQEIKQYENNMGIFTGKGAEAFRTEIEKKIKNAKREIEDIKKKMELLNT